MPRPALPRPGRKPAAQLSERELLQRHEANERRRLKGLRKKKEREEAVKARIRKATSAKFRRAEQRARAGAGREEEEDEAEDEEVRRCPRGAAAEGRAVCGGARP
jgi:hypothetical protein